jgi:hypothetical protein
MLERRLLVRSVRLATLVHLGTGCEDDLHSDAVAATQAALQFEHLRALSVDCPHVRKFRIGDRFDCTVNTENGRITVHLEEKVIADGTGDFARHLSPSIDDSVIGWSRLQRESRAINIKCPEPLHTTPGSRVVCDVEGEVRKRLVEFTVDPDGWLHSFDHLR